MTVDSNADATMWAGSATTDRAILEERARVLARPLALDEHGDGLVVLGFVVGGRSYAIEVAHVREVLAQGEISRLPWAPSAIAGVMNVRGEIVPVADASVVLRVGESGTGGPVLVLCGGDRALGLRVDVVDDVTTIAADTLVAPEGGAARLAGDIVLGLTASRVVLDPYALYADPRLITHPQEGT